MVEAEVAGSTAFAGEMFEAGDDTVCIDRPGDHDRRTLATVLVDDIQELQHPPIAGLIELEVERPEHVRGDRTELADGDPDPPQRLLVLSVGHPQPLRTPETVGMRLLLTTQPSRRAQAAARRHPQRGRFSAKALSQARRSELLVGRGRLWQALDGTGLAADPTGAAL